MTAIPGHACFGVFMGTFYGIAKKYDYAGEKSKSILFTILSLIVPMLIHGAYDYIATLEQQDAGWYFLAFIFVLFVISYILVGQTAKEDKLIKKTSLSSGSTASVRITKAPTTRKIKPSGMNITPMIPFSVHPYFFIPALPAAAGSG